MNTHIVQNHYQSFINHFKGLLTFQVFPESGSGKPFHLNVDRQNDRQKLFRLNQQGMGVFLMVNEGNGLGRKADHIKKVRAVFADLDEVSLDHAHQQLSKNEEGELNLHPHLIINTSPNKYHLYWFVDDVPCSYFKPIQQAIAQKLGSDSAVCDLGRVMRVPGFYHQKNEPHPVKISHIAPAPPFCLDEILEEFPFPEEKPKPIFRKKVRHKVTGGVDFNKLDMVAWFQAHGLYDEYQEGNVHWVRCPWEHEHSSNNRGSTIIYSNDFGRNAGFHCKHDHCQGRNLHQVAALLGGAKDYVK